MTGPGTDELARARHLGGQAARLLDAAGYRPHPASWAFGIRHPAYHDLLDPAASDGRRLWAARSLLARLDGHVRRERLLAEMAAERDGAAPDPYGRRWATTPHGALLEIAARTLRSAEGALAEAGIVPEPPTPKRYAAL